MRKFDVHTHCGSWNFIPGDAWSAASLVRGHRRVGIEKAVLTSVSAVLSDLVAGNQVTQTAIEQHEMLYGYIYVDPHRVEESLAEVETRRAHPRFVGVKSRDDYHGAHYNGPGYRGIFREIRAARLPALLHTFSLYSMECALELAAEYDAPVILTHMGGPEWRQCARFLSRTLPPNVYLDPVSSNSEPGKYELALAVFGEDRLVFGTDSTLFHPNLSIGAIESSDLSEGVKQKLYWDNPQRIFFPE